MDIVTQAKLLMIYLGAAPVMWLMIALSLVSCAIIVERALYFFSVRSDFAALARSLSQHLRDDDYGAARVLLEDSRALEAEVVLAGLDEAERGAKAVREAMAGASAVQRTKLDRRLGFLGTLGNNAPFVGLFGTVIGIILAFDELSRAGASAAATTGVMSSIAEALVATAIGLFVAIPAVAAYNAFQRTARGISANTEALSHILLVHLESETREEAPRQPRPARSHGSSGQLLAARAEGV
ncbi:MAG: MotA/TolQ/ExbB proton channel family protein [Myxococcaceae bacterium]|nr:MotA/TolQ/ExbB proton channel family protein [Myxococcaceae bacterium]